jgi:hypothetical protein
MYHGVTQSDDNDRVEAEVDGSSSRSSEKKERVLHTRIPAVLEAELKSVAAALRIPVSNLVRTILEDAVDIADRAGGHVEDRLQRAARSMRDERERIRARVERLDPLADVVAYQKVRMAVDGHCAKCGTELRAGEDGLLAIASKPGPAVFVCSGCQPEKPAER